MARNFNTAVAALTAVSDEQSAKADEQLTSAQAWLQGLVDAARQQIIESVPPPAKRQRVTRGKGKVEAEGKV